MDFSRKYSRNFITLNQESTAYNIDFKPCIGKCIIEVKEGVGKLNIKVQGLKPLVLYKVSLISKKDTSLKEAKLSLLNIDSSGKGELKTNFNPENIEGTNLTIEDINVIAIIVEDKNYTSPLVGYLSQQISWKDNYIQTNQTNTQFSEPDSSLSPAPDSLDIKALITSTLSPSSHIDYIKLKNLKMCPFETESKNTTWYRISKEDLTSLNLWKYNYNQFVLLNYKKYKHLILGVVSENNKESYILGVPCKLTKNFEKTGLKEFSKFIPINPLEDNKENTYGYRVCKIELTNN